MTLIALTGYMGSGKDTAADFMARKFYFKKIAFADDLRAMAGEIDPIIGTRIVDYSLSPSGIECRFHHLTYKEAIDSFGYDMAKRKHPEIRRFLNVFGTKVMRAIDPDIWVKLAFEKIEHGERVVISDLRFKNEAKAVREFGGYVVRIHRRHLTESKNVSSRYESEREIKDIEADWTITNYKTIREFYSRIENFLHELREIGEDV